MEEDKFEELRQGKMICPSADQLCVIINNVRCNECGSVFKNEPRLRLHHLKVHERRKLDKTVKDNIRYHCPEKSCIYSPESKRHFNSMKYLKQHYLKVHAPKRYPCTQCDKCFSTEAATAAHMRICGLAFTCMCLKTFSTYEALLTHAKRQSHSIDKKYKNLVKRPRVVPCALPPIPPPKKPISILPLTPQLPPHPPPTALTRSTETQTEDLKKLRKMLSPKSSRRRESRQTQTTSIAKEKRPRKTVETQTTPSIRKRSRLSGKRNHQVAQDFGSVNLFTNSPVALQHDCLQDFWERNTLGTQTSPEKHLLDVFNDSMTQTTFYDNSTMENVFEKETMTSGSYPRTFYAASGLSRSDPMLTEETIPTFGDRFSSIETQTEKPYPSIFDSDEGNLLSSNNETQTTEQFDNIEQLLYSNMCTQTCNDILPTELGLSDIQTQTAWTELGQGGGEGASGKGAMEITRSWLNIQTSHTETQTDLLSIFDELQ